MAKETSKDLEVAPSRELDASMLAEMDAAAAEAKKDIDLQEDARIPELSMLQATSNLDDVDGRPGQILDTLTGVASDTVDVIPITMYKTRVLFGSQLGEAPECNSPNGLDGYGSPGDDLDVRGPHGGGSCKQCPEANWRQGGKCKLRYNYLAVALGNEASPYDFENEVPRLIAMQGTSAKTASRLNTLMLSGKYPWSSVIRLATVGEKNDRGTYRVWQVAKVRDAVLGEMLHAFALSKQIAASRAAPSPSPDTVKTAGAAGDGDIPF